MNRKKIKIILVSFFVAVFFTGFVFVTDRCTPEPFVLGKSEGLAPSSLKSWLADD